PHVRAIFQERSGAIWFGPDGPAVRYQNGVFEEMGGRDGMPDGAASCFAEGPDGEVYVGFRKEGLAVWGPGAVIIHNTDTGLPTNTVRGLLADREGNIWIGFKGRGLALLSQGKWLNPEAFSELFQDQV